MGVKQLWPALRDADVVEALAGAEADAEIAAAVDGLAVAVDISIWSVQAFTQPDLVQAFPTHTARALKVCFDRCLQWLRFGCVPVAVLEGSAPAEKQATLHRRAEARAGQQLPARDASQASARSQPLQALDACVGALFSALGLPVLTAPGEAEALCAALQQAGCVGAAQTRDSDALVFGAGRVFHTLSLAVGGRRNELQACSLARVRAWLGLAAGGSDALLVLACLVGGDYGAGADRVGPRTAAAGLRHLLAGCEDDSDLFPRLEAAIRGFDPSELQALPTQCTGCKRCRHEGGRKGAVKHHTAANACACCPPFTSEQQQRGVPTCQAAAPDAACSCRFHATTGRREYLRVLQKLAAPGVLQAAAQARRAYQAQVRSAQGAVGAWLEAEGLPAGQQLRWQRRPDPVQVQAALAAGGGGLQWELATVRRKLRPLLREWDAAHPGPGAEFRPVAVSKEAGARGLQACEHAWAYVLSFERNGRPDADDSDGEAVEAGAAASQASQGSQRQGQQQGSLAPATPGAKPKAGGGSGSGSSGRWVRQSLVRAQWPQLVTAFEAKRRQAHARKAGLKGPAAAGADDGKQRSLLDFMRQAKPRDAAAPVAAAAAQPATPAKPPQQPPPQQQQQQGAGKEQQSGATGKQQQQGEGASKQPPPQQKQAAVLLPWQQQQQQEQLASKPLQQQQAGAGKPQPKQQQQQPKQQQQQQAKGKLQPRSQGVNKPKQSPAKASPAKAGGGKAKGGASGTPAASTLQLAWQAAAARGVVVLADTPPGASQPAPASPPAAAAAAAGDAAAAGGRQVSWAAEADSGSEGPAAATAGASPGKRRQAGEAAAPEPAAAAAAAGTPGGLGSPAKKARPAAAAAAAAAAWEPETPAPDSGGSFAILLTPHSAGTPAGARLPAAGARRLRFGAEAATPEEGPGSGAAVSVSSGGSMVDLCSPTPSPHK